MIRFEQVSHRFHQAWVLQDITVDLTESRIAIIGGNGSGKSTLARMINALLTPTHGTVTVNGLNTRKKAPSIRRQVGFLFSNPEAQAVLPTVGEDIAFSLRQTGCDQAQAQSKTLDVLARFGLTDVRDRSVNDLSSGQQQLLAFAAVSAAEPTILVADEPTTLLDLRNATLIRSHLDAFAGQVIAATHDLELVSTWERALCMDQGRIVLDGPADDVVAEYRRQSRLS